MKRILLCLTLLIYIVSINASAALVKFDFSASDFADCCFGLPDAQVPQSVVSGSILWEAATVDSGILRIIDINLEIAGEVFTVSELGFDSSFRSWFIGGTASVDPNNVFGHRAVNSNFGRDFSIAYVPDQPFTQFAYNVPSSPGIWATEQLTVSISEITQVSEPTTIIVLAMGLLVLVSCKRRLLLK